MSDTTDAHAYYFARPTVVFQLLFKLSLQQSMHADNKYIQALLQNDRTLLQEMYEKYFDKIKFLILKNGGNEEDAADIMQEGLVSIYNRALAKELILTCPMEAFLYHVCKNKWISEMRKRSHLQKVTFSDTAGYTIGQDSFEEANDALRQHGQKLLFEQKFTELGKACKEILQLNWSGKGLDEVAGILNLSYAYVRKKKSECIGRLVILVEQSPEFENLKWR